MPGGLWTEVDERIAGSRLRLTDRAGRWATVEVGKNGRTVNEVATVLGCDWHTVNDAVLAFGKVLVDHPDRFGVVSALGFDEHLFVKAGERRIQHFVTALVVVEGGQLLDLVPDRKSDAAKRWIEERGAEWRRGVRSGTLDLSATYRSVFDEALPEARLVADKFHVVRHMTAKLDECRRRVQNETLDTGAGSTTRYSGSDAGCRWRPSVSTQRVGTRCSGSCTRRSPEATSRPPGGPKRPCAAL